MNHEQNAGLVTPEIQGKLRKFVRIIMSYVDFQQAGGIAAYILENELHDGYPRHRFLLQGLNTGMIVAYCRPFSQNERGGVTKVPSLPERMLRVFSENERRMHVAVRDERDRVLAHSDSTAWELRPQVLRVRGNEMLVPVHHDIHAPLTREGTGQFRIMCNKLMDACFEERIRLEPELKPFLKVIQPDDTELERVAAGLGVALPR